MDKKRIPWFLFILLFSIMLLVVSVVSFSVGTSHITFRKIISTILNGKQTITHTILFDIRLPRILLAFAIGGALSIAGVILQAMFRNPLVEPYTLGISGGAALFVSLNIALKLNQRFGPFVSTNFRNFRFNCGYFNTLCLKCQKGSVKNTGVITYRCDDKLHLIFTYYAHYGCISYRRPS